MRLKHVVAVLAGLLGGALSVQAQTYPAEMSIIVPSVEVRSGPSQKFYATTVLSQGARVIVVGECKEQPGWLEIKPPPGSFSWINAKHVKQANTFTGVVDIEGGSAPVLVGSSVIQNKPDVEKSPGFVAGFIIKIVGNKEEADGATWLPIEPHPKEVRYIPADAVRPTQVATNSPTNWAQTGQGTTTPPGHPNQPANPAPRPIGGSTTSFSPSPPPPAANTPLKQPATTSAAKWSEYGVLRKTTFTRDGQPMYVLHNRQEQPLIYVTSAPGTSLERYVNETIAVFGPVVYQPDEYVRMNYVIASHVAVP